MQESNIKHNKTYIETNVKQMGLGGMDGRVLCEAQSLVQNEESPDSRGHGAAESAGDASRRKVQQRADRPPRRVRVKR